MLYKVGHVLINSSGCIVRNLDFNRTLTKLDTGCEDNWIALEILERASMNDQVNELDVRVFQVAFGGVRLQV